MNEYDGRLKKEDWIVLPVSLVTARILIERWHYAKSGSNTAVSTFGLYRKDDCFFESSCLGVSWWIPPTKGAAIATYPEGDWQKVLSLSRLVVSPLVPKNACSFLLSKSIKMLNNEQWECLVTYADTWQNHNGTIYKATNWQYMGLTTPSPVWINETKRGKMMGRKRGQRTLTVEQMGNEGFINSGSFAKHKFRMIIKKHNEKKEIINKF